MFSKRLGTLFHGSAGHKATHVSQERRDVGHPCSWDTSIRRAHLPVCTLCY
jgi:hypothetical protein